jgi:hypothetical protein
MDPTDDDEFAEIVERPDGFYWVADDGVTEVGPFATAQQAEADRDSGIGDMPEPGETLAEAEAELGINEWVDSETGAPAEGQSPPHLDAD